MPSQPLYAQALFGILANILAAAAILSFLILPRCSFRLIQPLRNGFLRPVAVAVAIHWLIYFGPTNLGPLFLKSSIQSDYNWVVRRDFIAQASLHSLVTYTLIFSILAIISHFTHAFSLKLRLQLRPAWSTLQVISVSILLLLISFFVAPVIGTDLANGGAWIKSLPGVLQPWGKGLFLIEAIPSVAAGWKILDHKSKLSPRECTMLFIVLLIQILTYILLRQRFLSMMAVLLFGVCFIRLWRSLWVSFFLVSGMTLAYVLPTALRYTRIPRLPGQPFGDYLSQSWQNFLIGMLPNNIFNSVVNDFSYNKSGLSSMSVVLDLRQQELLNLSDPWLWILAELFRAMPAAIKPAFSEWGFGSAESSVSQSLGVGLPGWTNPGVASELSLGWVIDLMETPFLDAVSSGGWIGILSFSIIITFFLTLFWYASCQLCLRWNNFWLLPCGFIAVVSLGSSWLGDLLVLLKNIGPWVLLCVLVQFLNRRLFSVSSH